MQNALAAIFDLDGTLVDNMSFHGDAWIALSERVGAPASREDFEHRWAGKTAREIFPYLLGRTPGAAEAAALEAEKESAYRAAYAPHLAPLPGLRGFLERLRASGRRCAIATAAPPENRAFVLEGLALAGAFDAVAGPGPGVRGKPHPDLFLAAAAALGVAPNRCVAFEDAANGVRAAVAAGMTTVGVLTGTGAATLREAGAAFVIADYSALPTDLEQQLFG